MNTNASFTRRALAPIIEMWDAFLEEEGILEESGLELVGHGTVVEFAPLASTSDRSTRSTAIHGEHSA